MSEFWFLTTSNKPRLRDPTKVERIMDKYWFDFDCSVAIERDAAAVQSALRERRQARLVPPVTKA